MTQTKKKALRTATAMVEVSRAMCGAMSGDRGIACFKIIGKDAYPSMYGLNLCNVVEESLGEGALVRVTVEVLKRGRHRRNPWIERKAGKGS